MSIVLKICLPERQLPEEKSDKVILPVPKGTLTLIDGRAPGLQMLSAGPIQLLDIENQVTKSWFINGGMAEIAENVCTASAEQLVDLNAVDVDDIKEKAETDNFYKSVYAYLKAFG